MFVPDENRTMLPIGARHLVRLYRSINPVQVALPGFQGQKAGAFLCVFAAKGGLRVAVVLELHDSCRLFFYLNEEGPVATPAVDALIEEGLYFCESMGFIMTDLELHKLPAAEREKQWDALPLAKGMAPRPVVPPVAAPGPPAEAPPVPPASPAVVPLAISASSVLRERRDGGRRKKGGEMGEDEFEARRLRLIVNVGRIFAAY